MIQNRRSFKDTATVFLNKPFLLIAACPCLRLLTPNKNCKRIISTTGFRESYIWGISYYLPLLILMCLYLAFCFWIPHPGNYMHSASGNGALVPRLSRLKLSEHHSVRPQTFLIRGWRSDSQKRNRSTQICVFSKCLPGPRHGMWCWKCSYRLRHCRCPQGSHKEGRDAHNSLLKLQAASSLPLTPVCPCCPPPQQYNQWIGFICWICKSAIGFSK